MLAKLGTAVKQVKIILKNTCTVHIQGAFDKFLYPPYMLHTKKKKKKIIQVYSPQRVIISHPLCFSHLAQSDYYSLPDVKSELGGVHFLTLKDVKQTVHKLVSTQLRISLHAGSRFVTHNQKCLDLKEDYVYE